MSCQQHGITKHGTVSKRRKPEKIQTNRLREKNAGYIHTYVFSSYFYVNTLASTFLNGITIILKKANDTISWSRRA